MRLNGAPFERAGVVVVLAFAWAWWSVLMACALCLAAPLAASLALLLLGWANYRRGFTSGPTNQVQCMLDCGGGPTRGARLCRQLLSGLF